MKSLIGALAIGLFAFSCAKIAESSSLDIKSSFTADGCKVTASDYRGYWIGVDSCKNDDSLKLELHNKIKGHKTIKYTQDSLAIPVGYDFKLISDGLRYLNNYSETVPDRFDVWDYFIGIALKNANSRGVTCPAINRIYDVYSGYCYIPAGSPSTDTIPHTYDVPQLFEGVKVNDQTLMNREHSWPKSWFQSATLVNSPSTGDYCYNAYSDSSYNNYYDYRAFTDIHHLMPTEATANSTRSNNPFGYVNAVANSYSATGVKAASPATGGKSGTPHHSNITQGTYAACGAASDQVPCSVTTVFEPPDHMKGDFARIYFYMATRYYQEDNCWNNMDAVNKANIKPWQEKMLRKWHTDDPVDASEITKNDLIQRIQGNRNPFIDHPEWVAKISDF